MIRLNKFLLPGLLVCSLAIITESCTKQLDQVSQTTVTNDGFWKDSNDLIIGTNYLYTSLPDFGTPEEDKYSDFATNITTTTVNTISDGSRPISVTDGNWNNPYQYIRAANNVIEKAANIPEGPMKRNCVGQARFFRALAYYRLVRAYGDVPLITKTISGVSDPALYSARTSREVVVDTIYADLDYAATFCPQPDAIPGSTSSAGTAGREYGRITRTAALALKSRVALYEGSWHKFHGAPEYTGTPNPNKHYTVARDAALLIMNEGKHRLFTTGGATAYQDLFRYPGEGYTNNKENILVRIYGQNIANAISSHAFMRSQLTDGGTSATRAYHLTALYSDGLPAGKSALDSNGIETGLLTDFRNRDPRFVLTSFKVGDPYASISTSNPVYGNTFHYHQQKYWTGSADFLAGQVFLDFIAIRYAEVLLNYAEAVYELNNAISDADLNLSINLLRNRATNNDPAKLALLTNAFVTANGLSMRNEIRRERSVELAFEGFRYWDLLRWKTAETELPKPMLMRKYFTGVNYGGSTVPTQLNGYVLFQAAAKRSFTVNKDYLWPIPTSQIGLSNGTLTQNPNWK